MGVQRGPGLSAHAYRAALSGAEGGRCEPGARAGGAAQTQPHACPRLARFPRLHPSLYHDS